MGNPKRNQTGGGYTVTTPARYGGRRSPNRVGAFFTALLGYGAVLAFPAHKVGLPLWAVLALGAVPALIGIVVGPTMVVSEGKRAAFWTTFWFVLLLTMGNLIVIGGRVQSSSGKALVIGIVSLIFALGAGFVAVGVNALRSRTGGTREVSSR